MTPDVGQPPTRGGSPDTCVAMACPLPTDVGIVDTAGCSEAPASPTMQGCFMCMNKTPHMRFTIHIQVLTVVDICYLIGKLAICVVHVLSFPCLVMQGTICS